MAAYVAEFVGTCLLVLTVGCNVFTGSPVWAVTWIAYVLMVCNYSLGGVSGANFNPAVSLALGLSRKLEWKEVEIYCCVQVLAGVAAGLNYGALLNDALGLRLVGKGVGPDPLRMHAVIGRALLRCLQEEGMQHHQLLL